MQAITEVNQLAIFKMQDLGTSYSKWLHLSFKNAVGQSMKRRIPLFLAGILMASLIISRAIMSDRHSSATAGETSENSASPAIAQASNISAQIFPGYMDFQGRYLAVLSDADMVASAYMDGDLGPRTSEMRDELAIVPLANGMPGEPRRIPVSNAVTAWPSLLVLSVDGRFAYVAETDGPALDGATQRSDLLPSPVVRAIRIDDSLAGEVVQEVETAGRAQGLSLRPQGDLLAVNVVNTERPQIGFLRIGQDGRLSDFTLADLPDVTTAPQDIKWSPDGEILAATFPREDAARFYRVNLNQGTPTVEQLGETIITGKFPGVGHWSPDGSHFFVTNLYWFGGAADRYVGSNVSTIKAIRVDRSPAAEHVAVSAAPAGASAEEFAIAPDGRTIVTLNMENSFLMPEDPRLTYHSSLTVMTWDPEREQLVARGTYPFEAILPEGITFDTSGRFLAVANFAHSNPRRPIEETTVDFWRVISEPPSLVKMDIQVPVMRGAHVVKVQP